MGTTCHTEKNNRSCSELRKIQKGLIIVIIIIAVPQSMVTAVIGQSLHFSVSLLHHTDESEMQYNYAIHLRSLLTQSHHLILKQVKSFTDSFS